MSKHAEACVAYAALCLDVAEKTSSAEDRREFLSFADAWEKLAKEIEQSERLAAFLNELSVTDDSAPDGSAVEQPSHTQPLRQLTAAIVAISGRVASEATAHHLSPLFRRRGQL
jgi:hypothetical protein